MYRHTHEEDYERRFKEEYYRRYKRYSTYSRDLLRVNDHSLISKRLLRATLGLARMH